MYEQSHRDYSLWLSASSSACHGLLIITVKTTPLPDAPARQNARTEGMNAAITGQGDASVMLLRRMQNTRRS